MKALLHEQTLRQLEAVLGTRSGSFIFHGVRGVGKAYTARELSKQLNCLGDDQAICIPCIQHEAGTYPDLITVRPEDKPSILIEQIRSLAQTLSLSLYHPAGTRVIIIDDAHMLTIDAQNALLKLIEEPPTHTLFLLVTDQPEALLPTVRSRCANVYFPTLADEAVAGLLTRQYNLKPSEALAIAQVASGAPGIGVMLATNPEEASTRLKLTEIAATVANQSSFNKLLLAKRLIDDKTDLARFGKMLHRHVVSMILEGGRETNTDVPRRLEALERFRRSLGAKVAPRVVLEQLMLEL